jgi:hypothetical protein
MIGCEVRDIKLGPTAWQIARPTTPFASPDLAGLMGINALHLGKPTKKTVNRFLERDDQQVLQ